MSTHFVKIPNDKYNHAVSDKRRPGTAYEVWVDGVKVGRVHTRSTEVWRRSSSGIRIGFAGYDRTWEAVDIKGHSVDRWSRTRGHAVELLLKHVA